MTELRSIKPNAFYNMTSLRTLEIMRCLQLHTIERNAFMHLPLLTLLDLSDNSLITIELDLLLITAQLVVRLSNNNWICDCKLVRIYEAIENPLSRKSLDDTLRCSTPQLLTGRTLLNVSEAYDVCSIHYITTVATIPISDNNVNLTKGKLMAPLHTNTANCVNTNCWVVLMALLSILCYLINIFK